MSLQRPIKLAPACFCIHKAFKHSQAKRHMTNYVRGLGLILFIFVKRAMWFQPSM